jgi:DNA-binding response OmpR family regulator
MTSAGKVVSQEELLEHVWNEDANLFTQTIKVHINNLRKKLKEAGREDFIRTIKGKGYVVGA